MTTVYGSIPTEVSAYPMCIGDFWMFYTETIKSVGAHTPVSVGRCPTNNGNTAGQYYSENNLLSPPHVAWSWHPTPYQALPGNQWVEVIHRRDPWRDEHNCAWFFYAK